MFSTYVFGQILFWGLTYNFVSFRNHFSYLWQLFFSLMVVILFRGYSTVFKATYHIMIFFSVIKWKIDITVTCSSHNR